MANDSGGGRRTAFPSILVQEVRSIGGTTSMEPREPLIGDGLDFGKFGSEDTIEYILLVIAARPEVAKAKARLFVRAKNPFEPQLLKVADSTPKKGSVNMVMDKYKVSVLVGK